MNFFVIMFSKNVNRIRLWENDNGTFREIPLKLKRATAILIS